MDSNHCKRICNPLPHHSVNCPYVHPFEDAHFLILSSLDISCYLYVGTNLFFPMRKKMEADRKTTPSLPSQSHSLSVTRKLRRVLPFPLRKYNYFLKLRLDILFFRVYQPFTFKGFYRSVCMF